MIVTKQLYVFVTKLKFYGVEIALNNHYIFWYIRTCNISSGNSTLYFILLYCYMLSFYWQ